MIVRHQPANTTRRPAPTPRPTLRRRAMCQLILAALFGGGAAHAATPPAFSQAWFAAKQQQAATAPSQQGGSAGNVVSYTPGSALLQQRVQQSITNLNNAAAALAAQMQQQKDAQAAAAQLVSTVPNGLGDGALKPAAGIAADPTLWQNALAPKDTVAGGKHTVEVRQTAKKAILTWDSFNVGRDTTLYFNQSAGNQSGGGNDWIALNRVNDPSAKPSQILGAMKAEGTVYVLNRNGVIFGQGAQVNTRSLLASSMNLFSNDLKTSNSVFLSSGISDPARVNGAVFITDTTAPTVGDVVVEKGASVTSGADGFVLIAAPNVVNRGAIVADDGQVFLASDRKISSNSSDGSLSLVPASDSQPDDTSHGIDNTGLIQARRGSITLFGPHVAQDGVVVASTSISRPGNVTIRGSSAGRYGPVEFGAGSVTAVLPEKDGATTTSSAAADKVFVPGSVTVVGSSITMDGGSLIEVPGGKVSLTAIGLGGANPPANEGRVYLDSGSTIDVSGLANIELPMSALLVSIPRIGQNELADSPLLRNSFLYTQKNVQLDSTVSGTRADGLDWIGSPILNAAGYVENMPRDISQMLTQGGSITLDGRDVIARSGSRMALDGGYLAYQSGWITTPNLLGADGLIHDIASADPDVNYVGFAGQFTSSHARWGVSQTYNSPLLGGSRRYEEGFVKGADAGTMTIRASEGLALDGDISAQATPGTRQTGDGTQPDGGAFIFDTTPASIGGGLNPGLRIRQSSRTLDSLLPEFGRDTLWSDLDVAAGQDAGWMVVSADTLGKAGFSSLDLTATSVIDEAAGTHLVVQPGGSVSLRAARVDIHGTIEAPSGAIAVTVSGIAATPGQPSESAPQDSNITLYDGALLDVRGMWVNDTGADAEHKVGARWINAGQVNLTTRQLQIDGVDRTGAIVLAPGSVIDVSGGGYVDTRGDVMLDHGMPAGRGGDVSLLTYDDHDIDQLFGRSVAAPARLDSGYIDMGGTIRSRGFSGGGTLALRTSEILIGGDASELTVPSGLWLSPAFFSEQGFTRYNLDSLTDVTVADGTRVLVRPENMLADLNGLRALGSGADLSASTDVVGVGVLDDWQRWATRGTTADDAPGLSIQAGEYLNWNTLFASPGQKPTPVAFDGVTGSVRIGDGASVDVDAGGVVSLSALRNIEAEGSISARGGSIDMSTVQPDALQGATARIWIGKDAVLDASGVSLIDTRAAPVSSAGGRIVPRTGDVLSGGSISLTGADSTFIVADDGARLDVSGAADTFELPEASRRLNGITQDVAPTAVWSDAGSIVFGASAGLYVGATLLGEAGSASAEGGTLQIVAMHTDDPFAAIKTKGILVRQAYLDKPDFAKAFDGTDGTADGTLAFAADVLNGSGISTLQLGMTAGPNVGQQAVAPLAFAGDVNLQLDRQVIINASGITALRADATSTDIPSGYVQGAGHVSISAPYVHITGASANPVAVAGDGILDVNASAIDMGGMINLQAWRQASFNAADDLRFTLPAVLAAPGQSSTVAPGMLFSTGDLAFTAGQVYPSSAYKFAINANASGLPDADGQARETTITFRPSGETAATPLSAGGALLVSANHIEQQGVIRVPSGTLVLGTADPATDAMTFGLATGLPVLANTQSVHLAPGSVTSVSLDGLTVPYGNTIDGVDWRYAVNSVSAAPAVTAPPAKQIQIHGNAVALDSGATIDLDGGGHLQGAEFVPGTGGTRDLLTTAPNGATVYAIIPGFNGKVGATDLAMDANGVAQPGVGRQVYLSGVPGLAAGYYTLLPAQYANVPGAMRIYQDTGSRDIALGRSSAFADGGYAVSGYYADAFTGAHDARTTTFVVQSAPVWQQYSQYRLTDADTFFTSVAAKNGGVAPPLAADAGRLQIGAGQRLDLGAALDATPATGGRTSQVDIAGEAIEILGSQGTARDGYLGISADGLTTLGAGSLLIGGTRRSDTDGDHVDVSANSLLLSNDATHPLAGQEIVLVANGAGDGITLESGSLLAARGDGNPVASQPLVFGRDAGTDVSGKPITAIDGNGALLRVSQHGAAAIVRHGLADTTAAGQLAIGAGASVLGDHSLTLDATGRVSVDDQALLTGDNIDATANRIAFIGVGAAAPDNSLSIGAATLAQWRSADSVILRSRGDIDFIGAQDIAVDHSLLLSAGALVGDGNDIGIHAGTFTFANLLGAAAGNALAGGGTLRVDTAELDFGQGTATLRGFGAFDATASSGIATAGQGGVDFGGASVDLTAPAFVVDGGTATTLTTTGAMRLHGADGTALTRDGLGGSLTLRASTIDDSMDLTAAAGSLTLDATQGGVHVAQGATLDVAGVTKQFFDTAAYAPGGTLTLNATGDIAVDQGAAIRYGGAGQAGDAGAFNAGAGGNLALGGSFDGHAAAGYRGGYLTLGAGGALDLDALAALASTSGATGLVDITSGQGDLALSAGHTLAAQKVYLYANGGKARIDGIVDASSPAGSHIEVWGRQGVDINGTLDAHVTTPEQRGGDVLLGTTGTSDGTVDGTYGYEVVQRADAGYIHIGADAVIDVSGGANTAFAGGKVSMRAPLLSDGDVPITVDNPAAIKGARDVTIEPYAVWSTKDDFTDPSKHFDGVIDPAGWFKADGTTMVSGTWTDDKGAALPPPADLAQQADYLTRYYFTPDAISTDHAGFFGYAGGDAANGPGTLMGFVQQPGFTFGDRFAGIGNLNLRPGIELRNPADGTNGGDIRVVTNWNLGAGVTGSDGKIHLAYRYDGEAPILTVRAAGDVDLNASITDGFYQSNDGATLNDPPPDDGGTPDDPAYDAAVTAYQAAQAYLDNNGHLWDGSINLADGDAANGMTPGGGTADITKDRYYQPLTAPAKNQLDDYYVNYQRYVGEYGDDVNVAFSWLFWATNTTSGFLVYNPTTQTAPQPSAYSTYVDYASGYENWLETHFGFGQPINETPSPLMLPIDQDYTAWSGNYETYISGHQTYMFYVFSSVSNGIAPQLYYAPFAPKEHPKDPPNPAYTAALSSYQAAQAYLDGNGNLWNGTINLADGDAANGMTPGGGTKDISKDKYYQPLTAPKAGQSDAYYTNYQKYVGEYGDDVNVAFAWLFWAANSTSGFLTYNPTAQIAPQPSAYSTYSDYAVDYENWLETHFGFGQPINETPSPLMLPIDQDYTAWSDNYGTYIAGHQTYMFYVFSNVSNGIAPQLFYAPFAPRDDALVTTRPSIPYGKPRADNSPSNMPTYGNATSLASATLMNGPSTSYRFTAGADVSGTDPLATLASSSADVQLDGHFEVKDTVTDPTIVGPRNNFQGKTLVMPTTIRTGTGDIDMTAAGDIRWLDADSPATVYTAGAPADGTTAATDITVVRPSVVAPGFTDTQPDMLVNGLVNPDHAGDVHLHAGGDILGLQNVVDADGSQTKGAAGTSVAQYWWQWMQMGNSVDGSRSSIDFANFHQGVMSLGGNVDVAAGGDISELSVSLPTTWYKNPDGQSITTVGGGDLSVHAGGDILSGTYFVAKGTGDIRADGAIAASPSLIGVNPAAAVPGVEDMTSVSTIFALQDAQLTVRSRSGADIGGVYDPSYFRSPQLFPLLPAGQSDSQGYSTSSSFDVSSSAGNVVFGSLGGVVTTFGASIKAGPILPATVALSALGGDIDIRTGGELFPSSTGNLTLLADKSVALAWDSSDAKSNYLGLIDSSPDDMPSPLNPISSVGDSWLGFDAQGSQRNSAFHLPTALHVDDTNPVRVYALGGDIVNGDVGPGGFWYDMLTLMPSKQAYVRAGRDVINLSLIGQHTRRDDITWVSAGRDIYDTPYPTTFQRQPTNPFATLQVPPAIVVGGPGTVVVDAGRDVGPFVSQADLSKIAQPGVKFVTGVQTVGNLYNPYLPHESADVLVNFGISPGIDASGFVNRYLEGGDGLQSLVPDLISFMQRRVAGASTATGLASDDNLAPMTADEARALFAKQPEVIQRMFAEQSLFKLLATVGTDYNDSSSVYAGKYARGYEALDTLFPSAWGYTANGSGQGGLNGAAQTITTGNLDIRSSTIQTQQGGDVTLLGPGGQALIGSTAAPAQYVTSDGTVAAGPNTMGLLTLEKGNINVFTDRSLLLAQSRVFTEQGGDVTIWSSNGDINAGQGAKTNSEVPPPTFLCDNDAWCRLDARGQVAGAGIATLQSVEGAPEGNAYLIAPRGTVDAGDAGIRVSGNLVIAAARVANADNIQVKGDAIGIPVTAAVNVGALNAASAAATAASQAAEDVARKQQGDARDKMPSEISVHVLRDGDNTSSVAPVSGYDNASPVQVLGRKGQEGQLTDAEKKAMRGI
ncbi:filamentous haemagglutinin family protein [Luteibacter aegosomatissinici]|uniref:filamentous haemagglutinin family protein n=1 Tax=Luteibacter aegosomatissinici TaxID=2911539 RepID=UPI001FFBEAD4|nr:filamentous haemagglutinin family protein [Luteibacter aegosomatissinici]UPG92949.1 filamentous hemagglutinin family protein [Luteibacter aegosomatissinici]